MWIGINYRLGSNRYGTRVEGIPTLNGAIEALLKAKIIREWDIKDLKILEIYDSCHNRVYKDE